MNYYWLILIPIISALIGWFTNWVAIKMLFHPKKPIKILGISFQGVFPKKQKQFAERLGQIVGNELLSFKEIEQKISNPDNIQKIMPLIEEHIDNFLRVKLAEQMPIISMFIGNKTIEQLKSVFITELKELFPKIMGDYMNKLENELNLEKIVFEKVNNFSSDKLEEILNSLMKKEFKFIEILGGVLGFLIGIVQVLITLLV
ncbi:MAG: DUF445 family protein [Chitinophagales bacterium]|nr:DUF445 family protein [Chitinophagales bacterium]